MERLQALVNCSPHNAWLGMTVRAASDAGVGIEVAWREEFISGLERGAVHGGVLAGLVDSGAVFAVMALSATSPRRSICASTIAGNSRSPVAMRVHGGQDPPRPKPTAEAYVYDQRDRLVRAAGRP